MGHAHVVVMLLENGAKTESPTAHGETALHLAARAGQIDCMRTLLRNGANVDATAKVRLILLLLNFQFCFIVSLFYWCYLNYLNVRLRTKCPVIS